ncbi:O-antigen ligase family protein [Bacillus sp. CGMCC 1.60114]|uniref:O-antigen ligase family protein n=1 Tax=unclassified Bacillus (in: firmicutes) TaxID=185979 RepID=UPI0036450EDC
MINKFIQKEYYFAYFLLLFIALQPVLDLVTSLSIHMLHMSATLGVVVRFIVMLLTMIYLFINWKEPSTKKHLIYICLLGIILAAGLINNMLVKHPFALGEEVKFIAKCMYPIVMLFGYVLIFKILQDKQFVYHKMLRYFLYAVLFISIVMVISIATGTDFKSYSYEKVGSKGWFYAANELSAILAVTFPIVTLYSIHKTTSFAKAYYWIPTILALYASIMVGTKVGYGAIILTLGIALFFSFIEYMMKRKEEGKGATQLVNTIVSLVVLAGVIAATPFTPIAKNMGIHLKIYEQKQYVGEEKARKKEKKAKEGELTAGEVNSLIYSDRDKFLKLHKKYFKEAPLSQKLLGMGYAGNYKKTPKMVEMDFYDLFFSFGIIGFIMYLLPFVYFGIRLALRVFTNFKSIITVKYMLLASTLVLALGIAYTAGHVFTAPAVSIFFVVILAYLIVDLKAE